MKKVLGLLFILVMMVSMLSGCQGTEEDAGGNDTMADESVQKDTSESQKDAVVEEDEQVFRLGLISPLTGAGAASGAVQANAVKMAVDEINSQGGIGGKYMIELYSEDDEGVPANSVKVAQKLVNQDNVHAVIGALNSSCTLANMKITEKAGIPQITPSSSNATIVEQGNEYIFRTTATDTTHVKTLYKYITEKLNGKNVAIIYESSDFGTGAYKLLEKTAPEYGINIVQAEVYNAGEKDFSVQLTKIDNTEPDALIIWGYYTEAALICKQVNQYGIDIPLVGTGYNSPMLLELGGEDVNGLIFTTAFTEANPDPNVQEFDKKYKEIFSSSYDQNGPQAYDSVYLLAEAIVKAGTFDGKAVRDMLIGVEDFEGVAGVYNFDERGEMVKDLLVVQIIDGEHTIIPFD